MDLTHRCPFWVLFSTVPRHHGRSHIWNYLFTTLATSPTQTYTHARTPTHIPNASYRRIRPVRRAHRNPRPLTSIKAGKREILHTHENGIHAVPNSLRIASSSVKCHTATLHPGRLGRLA
jgi:hypothetical protein